MKKRILLFFLITILTAGCNTSRSNCCYPWSTELISDGNYETAINNAVIDFSNTSKLVKEDSAFWVRTTVLNQEKWGVEMSGINLPFINILDNNEVNFSSTLPTRFIIYNERLFFWYDSSYSISTEMISKLNEYHLIDTVATLSEAVWGVEDAEKAATYFFCKNDLLSFKKIETNLSIGYYEPPRLRCKSK